MTLERMRQRLDALGERDAALGCVALLQERAGHDAFALKYLVERAPGASETCAVLRAYIHDPAHDVDTRALAISLFAAIAPPLLHVDLIMLLADPAQPVALRCEALDQVGGYRVRACAPAVHALLQHATDDSLIFWCIYALGSIGYEPALEMIQAHLGNQTVIAPYGSIAAEARQACALIALFRGYDGDEEE